MSQPLRVLVIGDPYMPVAAYTGALASLGDATVTTMQIPDITTVPTRTESEHRLAGPMAAAVWLATATRSVGNGTSSKITKFRDPPSNGVPVLL